MNRYSGIAVTRRGASEPSYERRVCGFTLIELLVVMVIIGILLSLVAPRYFASVDRAKEAALRADLRILRIAIDQRLNDKGAYPTTLDQLVQERYIRDVPKDPMTERSDTWIVVPPVEGGKAGVYDVHSGAPGAGRDGTEYSSW